MRDAQGTRYPPTITAEQLKGVVALVQRVGGPNTTRDLHKFLLMGYTPSVTEIVSCNANPEAKPAAAVLPATVNTGATSGKYKFAVIPKTAARMKIWVTHGKDAFSNYVDVVQQLLCCHTTSSATERNWSVWGRVYAAARNRLGIERAKKMIAMHTNTRHLTGDDVAVSLAVIDGEI